MRLRHTTSAPGSETEKVENAGTHAVTTRQQKTFWKSPKELRIEKLLGLIVDCDSPAIKEAASAVARLDLKGGLWWWWC